MGRPSSHRRQLWVLVASFAFGIHWAAADESAASNVDGRSAGEAATGSTPSQPSPQDAGAGTGWLTLDLARLWAEEDASPGEPQAVPQRGEAVWPEDYVPPAEGEEGPSPGRGPFRVRQGLFLGAFFSVANVEGEADGERVYVDPAEVLFSPELDDGVGFGVAIGGRGEHLSVELNYQRTFHDWSHDLAPWADDAALNLVNLAVKIYPLASYWIQPTIHLAVGCPWLEVDGGSLRPAGRGDATYFGISGEAGGGLTLYPLPEWGISAIAGYRVMYFVDAWGEDVSGPLSDGLDAHGWFLQCGVTYTF